MKDKDCSCNVDLAITTFTKVDTDIQISALCVNLLSLAKTHDDNIFYSEMLKQSAKDLWECNLKGKTIVGTKHKYTWKRIIEDNIK